MSQPDLFVVCKNCGSEVSPYVTECPYCGQRVRKRAPKIDRSGGEPDPAAPPPRAQASRLRADEIAGIAPDTRPYATFGLILICVIAVLVYAAKPGPGPRLSVRQGAARRRGLALVRHARSSTRTSSATRSWRWCRSGIFGTLLERRFGPVAVVLTFILAGAAGAALAATLETPPLLSDVPIWPVFGANGAALGLLCAWLVDDRLAARRGEDRENDLLGVYMIAAVLVLLSLTTEEANIGAAVGGALAGSVIGLLLPRITRRA